jgi:hypothetical protein
MDMAVSEMEFPELAPGDPISQGGNLREFRYSQFSECPSAPFNTAGRCCALLVCSILLVSTLLCDAHFF